MGNGGIFSVIPIGWIVRINMVQYYYKSNGLLKEVTAQEPFTWVNLHPPFETQELEAIAEEFNIPLDFLTDPLDINERSRYEKEDDVRLIVLNTPILNKFDQENESVYITVPIGIVWNAHWIITISSFENPVLNQIKNNRIKNIDPANLPHFILKIFEHNVYRFLNCLKKLNLKRNIIEQELSDTLKNEGILQLLKIEKSLVYFVNSLKSNELLKLKIKRLDFIGLKSNDDWQDLFEDVIIDNSQALEMANVYTNILGKTTEAYSSIINNNLNRMMSRLTFVTLLMALPNIITGLFGMNVPIPFQHWPYAFYLILALAISMSTGLAFFLNRKRLF
jgi:magnesium transporter